MDLLQLAPTHLLAILFSSASAFFSGLISPSCRKWSLRTPGRYVIAINKWNVTFNRCTGPPTLALFRNELQVPKSDAHSSNDQTSCDVLG